MAEVTGARSTTNVLSDQLAIDIGDQIKLLEPDVQILTIFTRETTTKNTVATKFKWLEDEYKARFDTTSAAATAEATSVSVTNPSYYQQWDQVIITRTGEQLSVEAIEATAIKVTRAIGSTAAAINEGDEICIIGTAQPEGDTSKAARSKTPSKVENNTQIFRTPFEITGSLEASDFVVQPSEWPRLAQRAGAEHAKDKEYSFLFGRKSALTPGATEKRTTGGALSFITTNQTDAGGDLSEAEWNAFMGTVMRYGNSGKLALAGVTGISALNKYPASKLMTKQDESTYGINVTQYNSAFGHVNLVYHRLMEGQKYGGYLLVLDIGECAYRPLSNATANRDTKVHNEIQARDLDGKKSEYLTEAGLEFGMQRKHGLITGITS
jgi:hypothetical protein